MGLVACGRAERCAGAPASAGHARRASQQVARIQAIYEEMKKQAVPLGNELIEGERALEEAFVDGSMDAQDLRRRLHRIARIRAALRYVPAATTSSPPVVLQGCPHGSRALPNRHRPTRVE